MTPGHATPTLEGAAGAGTGSTTHFSVVDVEGNAVATPTRSTTSMDAASPFPGAGVLLNDIMDDFTVAPGPCQQLGS